MIVLWEKKKRKKKKDAFDALLYGHSKNYRGRRKRRKPKKKKKVESNIGNYI